MKDEWMEKEYETIITSSIYNEKRYAYTIRNDRLDQ